VRVQETWRRSSSPPIPTVEGETTALYIARQLQGDQLAVSVSRPASGIPVGGELAAVDRLTLAQALNLRRRM
jgi:recombination protein RecR